MRILFLCSSQEAARDGVGDYVRELAGACRRRGHSCAVIALHDPYVAHTVESSGDLPLLRLPVTLSWLKKLERARAFITTFRPDWISLQFVAYGLDGRGMMFRLTEILQKLTSGSRLHFMFHELWIGEAPPARVRHRLIGSVQRVGIRKMFARLRPQVATTTNPFYQSILSRAGIQTALLPLFGNIPVFPSAFADAPKNSKRNEVWNGVFFGALHPEWKPEPLFSILLRAAEASNKKLWLHLAGRVGESGMARWNNLQREYGARIRLSVLGEASAEAISELLQISDFGITTTPWQLLGKSGTVAAMLDHGLPVLVSRDDVPSLGSSAESIPVDPLLHRCDDALEAKLIKGLSKRPAQARLDDIADQFLKLLA
jgi:hypothetical protein